LFADVPRDGEEFSLETALRHASKATPISTGSQGLDTLLGGGYTPGEIVEIYGSSNTGKTQLALQAALMGATAGMNVVFVDTESTFRPERIAQIATVRGYDSEQVLSRIIAIRAYDARKQLDSLFAITDREDSNEYRLVIVDTLTKNFSIDYAGKSKMIYRQQQLNVYLNLLARDAYLNRRAVILTNRVARIGLNGKSREVDIGGSTVRHLVHKAIHLMRSGYEVLALLDESKENRVAHCAITERGFV
jgi:RecA/RadA recombinase